MELMENGISGKRTESTLADGQGGVRELHHNLPGACVIDICLLRNQCTSSASVCLVQLPKLCAAVKSFAPESCYE